MSGKKKMIRLHPFKEKEKGSPFGGQWKEKEKVLMLEGQWKAKNKVCFHFFSFFPQATLLKPSSFSLDIKVLFYHF
jgi:hypothetical protein